MYLQQQRTKTRLAKHGKPAPGSLVIIGVRGTNRSPVVNELLSYLPDVKKVITHTTREKRFDEIHEREHFFCKNKKEFNRSGIIEGSVYATNPSCYYGFSLTEIATSLKSKKPLLFVVSTARSVEMLYDFFGKSLSFVRLKASHKTIFDALVEHHGYGEAQRLIGFSENQNNDFEDLPIFKKIIDFTIPVTNASVPAETAASIADCLGLVTLSETA